VLGDYSNPSNTGWLNLGDQLKSSSQFFNSLVRYPFVSTPVNISPAPITHSVNMVNFNQISIDGDNANFPGSVTIDFFFNAHSVNPGATLQNAIGFTGITSNTAAVSNPNKFTIKAIYAGNIQKYFNVDINAVILFCPI